jgi:mannitol-specific phosphotransferase system IIBC component
LVGIPTGWLLTFLPPMVAAMVRQTGWQPTESHGQMLTGAVLVTIFLLVAFAAWALRQWARHGFVGACRSKNPPIGQAGKFGSP